MELGLKCADDGINDRPAALGFDLHVCAVWQSVRCHLSRTAA